MIKNSVTHIAFLGPKGSYSHIAAMEYANHYFNKIIEYSCQNFSDIFTLVEHKYAEYGILPIENSNSGPIDEVCSLLLNTQLILVGEIIIPIKHRILGNNNTSLQQIQVIYSHLQPVLQCSKFLKNFSRWKIILCKSSAVAIQTVAQLNQSNLAALGSLQGGLVYGLHPLLSCNLSNYYSNTTRFIVLKKTNLIIENNKTLQKIMLIISIYQQPEKLYAIVAILRFYNIKINFLKLCTVFNKQSENIIILEITTQIYNFYTQEALYTLQKHTRSLKILGCYPITFSINTIHKL